MGSAILATKLYIPPQRGEFLLRPVLLQRLEQGLARKLSLVCAPAGFGKTTLLSCWARRSKAAVAWLTLDERDSDLTRFLTYLIAALQTVCPELGDEIQASLQSPQPPHPETLLTNLINEIAGLPASQPGLPAAALVLDDYHLINSSAVHSALTFLLDHLPLQLHLLIAARANPPLPLARLRVRGELNELRAADLRFSLHETGQFLALATGTSLDQTDVAALNARTEGWAAGLQIAAVSMRGQTDLPAFIRSFTGSNRYILDYLFEEVLQREPQEIQKFLLQTSVLERMCAELCQAVAGTPLKSDLGSSASGSAGTSQEILEYLEQSNLFIIPLDEGREWFRYHRLFSDLLRKQLHTTQPELVQELNRRASLWYERAGFEEEAIEFALRGEDYQRAAELISAVAEKILLHSEIDTLIKWVERLPVEQRRLHPQLGIYYVWALLAGGRPMNKIKAGLAAIPQDQVLLDARLAVVKAFLANLQGHLLEAADLSRQALKDLPADEYFLRSLATWTQATSAIIEAGLPDREQLLDELLRASLSSGNLVMSVIGLIRLAEVHVAKAELQQAKTYYEQALERATDLQGRYLPVACEALLGLGEVERQWNHLDSAEGYLQAGIQLSKRWREVSSLSGYLALARLRQAQDDPNGALEAIQQARRVAEAFDAAQFDDQAVALWEAELQIAQGNLPAAQHWAEHLSPPAQAGEPGADDAMRRRLIKYETIVLSRLWIAEDRPQKALEALQELLPTLQAMRRTALEIEVHILRAIAWKAMGEGDQALSALEIALRLAEPGGGVRIFIDEGSPMDELLAAAARAGIHPAFCARLLEAMAAEKPPGERAFASAWQALPEPLSERELEVLLLLCANASIPDIAAELVIAVSTVRSHIKQIYAKLGAHNRLEAVDIARQLHLA